MAENDSEKGSEPEGARVRVVWGSQDHLATIYANQLVITHAGPEFYLVFGELPALLLREQGTLTAGQKPPESVVVKPLARIAVTPESMLAMAEAIKTNIDKFMKEMEEKVEKELDKEDDEK